MNDNFDLECELKMKPNNKQFCLRKTPTGVLYRHKIHNLSAEDIRNNGKRSACTVTTTTTATAVAVAIVAAAAAFQSACTHVSLTLSHACAYVLMFILYFFPVHLANAQPQT